MKLLKEKEGNIKNKEENFYIGKETLTLRTAVHVRHYFI